MRFAALALGALIGLPAPPARPVAVAVFSGGCYWGTESVFEHVKGVTRVTAGFALPDRADSSEAARSGFAEAARVEYDPSRITYRQLLQVFFLVAHDPTEVDRQGPDIGPRYRSAVFVSDEEQRSAARVYLDSLRDRHVFPAPLATQIIRLGSFRAADDQRYVDRHPDDPYVVQYDRPRLTELRRAFPSLYRE